MRFSTSTIAAVAALLPTLAFAKDGRTFAVMHFYGDGTLVTGRMDPIVDPGVPAAHVHAVMGGNAFSLTMPGDAATKATCTNSRIKNDHSNYWTPTMYFQNSDKTFTPVPMFYMNVYYFFEATDDEIVAFPPGFRMVSGNPKLRTPPSTGGSINIDSGNGAIQAVGFTCPRTNTNSPLYPVGSSGLNGVGIQDPGNKGAGVGFPDQNCDGYASPLRADIHFPSCYNPAAGPEAYASNTAFPSSAGASGAGKQNCPKGWLHLPHLFYEVYWNTPKFASQWTPGQGKQPFVLSNGDPTGYGLHGDFINGWDTNTLQTIIDTCDAGDSGFDKCPNIPGGLTDTSVECHMQSAVDDDVTGTVSALPGNNPVSFVSGASGPVAGNSPIVSSASSASSAAAGQSSTVVASAPTPTVKGNKSASAPSPTTLATVASSPNANATATTQAHAHHHTHTRHHRSRRVAAPTAEAKPIPRYMARR